MAYKYGPALVAFSKGTPTEEIAEVFKIPIDSLKAKIREEGWNSLVNELNVPNFSCPKQTEEALKKCEENRHKNYEIASKLRDDAKQIIEGLLAGTLRIKKQFHNRGQIVEFEAEPTLADRVNLATYVRTITDLTYRALGDMAVNGGPGELLTLPAPPPVTIILPTAVAAPRQERVVSAAIDPAHHEQPKQIELVPPRDESPKPPPFKAGAIRGWLADEKEQQRKAEERQSRGITCRY